MHKITVVFLLIAALLLCACDESEPLAPGESALSDVELDKSEIIEGGWPADLLPEGFPEPKYTEIYSVERKDNEVIIVMFGENDQMNPPSPCTNFYLALRDEYEYKTVSEEGYFLSVINDKGVIVKFDESKQPSTLLTNIESPTGYVYEIRVSKIEINDDMKYLFWKYPSKDTDLGLEEIAFDEWPTEYLPENFPNPKEEPNTDIKIINMEQKKTGVYITIEGTVWDIATYENNFYYIYGYNNTGSDSFYINKNGDYLYITNIKWGAGRDGIMQDVIQINKCNNYVKKD